MSVRVILNPCKASCEGIYSLAMRVVYRRKKKEYSLGWQLHSSNFRADRESVVFSSEGILKRKEQGSINRLIKEEKESLMKSFQFLERTEPGFDLSRLMMKHFKKQRGQYVETFILQYIHLLRIEGKQSTADAYASSLYSLRRFCDLKKVKFKDIDFVFITDYIHHLRKREISENTLHMYLSNFRAIYNKACKQGIRACRENPFAELGVRRQETVKRALTKQEIARIASVDLAQHPRIAQVRDIFMFSFYCRGMSFVDVIHLRRDSITRDTIFYERNKTGQQLQIGMFQAMHQIVDKYQAQGPYIFPYLDPGLPRSVYTQYRYALGMINRYLKQLGQMLELPIPLTTYVARHSWATIAKNEGISIALISEGLGHTSEKTTKIYLESFPHEAINRINEKVAMAISSCIADSVI